MVVAGGFFEKIRFQHRVNVAILGPSTDEVEVSIAFLGGDERVEIPGGSMGLA
jgi:hypothetical protein